jgi:membrane-associated phospholipid phosphatase
MSSALRLYIWLALGSVAAVVVSILWVDRPVASFAHNHFRYLVREPVAELSHFPNPLFILALILSVILMLRIIFGRSLSWHQANIFVCSLGVVITEETKSILKFIFGRTWPETWVDNNPSFIRDDVYGFHFMHGGIAYQSFPSGHMAAACTVIAVVWIRYPQFRQLCVVAGLLVGMGLVGGNYHFLSDVVVGAFVGLSIGWIAIASWDKGIAWGIVRSTDKKQFGAPLQKSKRRGGT